MFAAGRRRQLRYITSATMAAGMPTTTNRQPSLVMQLMMVSGSRSSFKAMLMGRNNNPNNLNMI